MRKIGPSFMSPLVFWILFRAKVWARQLFFQSKPHWRVVTLTLPFLNSFQLPPGTKCSHSWPVFHISVWREQRQVKQLAQRFLASRCFGVFPAPPPQAASFSFHMLCVWECVWSKFPLLFLTCYSSIFRPIFAFILLSSHILLLLLLSSLISYTHIFIKVSTLDLFSLVFCQSLIFQSVSSWLGRLEGLSHTSEVRFCREDLFTAESHRSTKEIRDRKVDLASTDKCILCCVACLCVCADTMWPGLDVLWCWHCNLFTCDSQGADSRH